MIYSIHTFIFIFLIFFLPFIYTIDLGAKNLYLVYSDKSFFISAKISLLWAFVVSFLLILLGLSIAWFINKNKNKFFYILLTIPWAIPAYVAIALWRAIMFKISGNINLVNPWQVIFWAIFVHIWLELPITISIFLSSFQSISYEIEDMARLDGIEGLNYFFNIIFPKISSTILGWFLISFSAAVKSFNLPYLLTDGLPFFSWSFSGKHIIGGTTFLGLLNFKIFQKDIDLSLPYSLYTYIVIILIVIILYSIKKFRLYAIFILLLRILLKSNPFISVLYAISIFSKRFLFITSIVEVVYSLSVFILKDITFVDPTFVIALIYLIFSFKPSSFTFKYSMKKFGKISRGVVFYVAIFSILIILFSLINTSLSYFENLEFLPVSGNSFTLENFKRIFTEYQIHLNMKNSLIISLLTSIFTIFFAFPTAYYISRKKKDWIITIFLYIHIAFSGMHVLIPLYVILKNIHLLNTFVGLSMIYTAFSIPYAVIILKGYIDSIPIQYEEAALLNTNRFHIILRIVMPLALPSIMVTSIVSFMKAWNGFLPSLLFILDESKYPLSIKLFYFVGDVSSKYPQWNLFCAASIVNLIIVFILFYSTKKKISDSYLKGSSEF